MANFPNLLPDEQLNKLLEEYELPELENYLRDNQRPVVKLVRGAAGHEHVGHSRFGGFPDLPEDMQWPQTKDGEWMTLLAQLNLAQLSAEIESGNTSGTDIHRSLLPKKGMLYFFAGVDEPAYDVEHRVLYWPHEDASRLTYREPEQTTVLEEEAEMNFRPFKVHAHAGVEFPNYAYSQVEELEDEAITEDTYDKYLGMTEEMNDDPQGSIGKTLGYPAEQHGDAEFEAVMFRDIGQYTYRPADDRKRLVKYYDGDEQRVDQEIDDMLMLLEIDSDDPIGFMWWDAGYIHFFISRQDLLELNFDRTYCSIYSS